MSIPLDRLYNFLDSKVDRDLIIYRWWTHGSKKLSELALLHPYAFIDQTIFPTVIFHDQEPLDIQYFTTDDKINCVFNILRNEPEFKNLTDCDIMNFISRHNYKDNSLASIIGAHSIYDKYLLVHSEKNSNEINNFLNETYFTRRSEGYPGPGILPSDPINFYLTLQLKL